MALIPARPKGKKSDNKARFIPKKLEVVGFEGIFKKLETFSTSLSSLLTKHPYTVPCGSVSAFFLPYTLPCKLTSVPSSWPINWLSKRLPQLPNTMSVLLLLLFLFNSCKLLYSYPSPSPCHHISPPQSPHNGNRHRHQKRPPQPLSPEWFYFYSPPPPIPPYSPRHLQPPIPQRRPPAPPHPPPLVSEFKPPPPQPPRPPAWFYFYSPPPPNPPSSPKYSRPSYPPPLPPRRRLS